MMPYISAKSRCLKMSVIQIENMSIAFPEPFHFHISVKMGMVLNCLQLIYIKSVIFLSLPLHFLLIFGS